MKKIENALANIPGELLRLAAKDPCLLARLAREESEKRNSLAEKKASLELKTEMGSLYRGGCLAAMDFIEDESLDCVFADPPFNLKKDYGGDFKDDMSEEDYLRWTRMWVEKCAVKLRPGGAFFVFNIPKWAVPTAAIMGESLQLRHWIAVDLTLSLPVRNRLYPSHYALLYFSKGKPKTFNTPRTPIETCRGCGRELKDYGGHKKKLNPKGMGVKDVWVDIAPVRHRGKKNRKANELHPKLLDRVLDMATNKGDTVFDPFGGSGTTFAVAQLKERKWVGSELGDCSAIKQRLADLSADRAVLSEIENEKGRLFTQKALAIRDKNGISNRGYPLGDDWR